MKKQLLFLRILIFGMLCVSQAYSMVTFLGGGEKPTDKQVAVLYTGLVHSITKALASTIKYSDVKFSFRNYNLSQDQKILKRSQESPKSHKAIVGRVLKDLTNDTASTEDLEEEPQKVESGEAFVARILQNDPDIFMELDRPDNPYSLYYLLSFLAKDDNRKQIITRILNELSSQKKRSSKEEKKEDDEEDQEIIAFLVDQEYKSNNSWESEKTKKITKEDAQKIYQNYKKAIQDYRSTITSNAKKIYEKYECAVLKAQINTILQSVNPATITSGKGKSDKLDKDAVEQLLGDNFGGYVTEQHAFEIFVHDIQAVWGQGIINEENYNSSAMLKRFLNSLKEKLEEMKTTAEENAAEKKEDYLKVKDHEAQLAKEARENDAKRKERLKNQATELFTQATTSAEKLKEQLALKEKEAHINNMGQMKRLQEIMKPSNIARISGASIFVGGSLITLWHSSELIKKQAEKYLNKPKLIRQTTKPENLWQSIFGKEIEESRLDEFVAPDHLKEQLEDLIEQTREATAAEQPYKNILLYGPPGTGKTMFANIIARESEMDWAMLSGSDFNNFEKLSEAIEELNKVMAWAQTTKRGLMVFVDEAECFLRQRSFPDTDMRSKALTTLFLSHVDKPSNNKVMWIFASNHRGELDDAVESRISEAFEFRKPTKEAASQMFFKYLDKFDLFPADEIKDGILNNLNVFENLVGRDIEEIATDISRQVNISNKKLNADLLAKTIARKRAKVSEQAAARAQYMEERFNTKVAVPAA